MGGVSSLLPNDFSIVEANTAAPFHNNSCALHEHESRGLTTFDSPGETRSLAMQVAVFLHTIRALKLFPTGFAILEEKGKTPVPLKSTCEHLLSLIHI